MASRILEELKQTRPFPRLDEEALVSLLRTAAVLEHELGERLRPFGLTYTQYNVLRILKGAGADGLCGRAVGERLIAKVPDVPRLLDRMVEMGLVRRERDGADRRHVTARITPRGSELLRAASRSLREVAERRFAGVVPGRLESLLEALDAVRAAP